MCKKITLSLNKRSWLVLSALLCFIYHLAAACPPDAALEKQISQNKYGWALSYVSKKIPREGDTLSFQCDAYYLVKAAYVCNRMGRNTDAKWMINDALRRCQSRPDSSLLMEAHAIHAHVLNSLGNFNESVEEIQQVLSYALRKKDKKLEHACTNLLGGIELQNGRSEVALSYYTRSLALAVEIPYPEFEIYDEMQLAYALLFTGQAAEGKQRLDKSMQRAVARKDSLTLTVATLIQAYLYQSANDINQWQKAIQQAISLASVMGHESLLSAAYSQLLEYHVAKKDFPSAIRYGNQALSLMQKQPMPLFEVYLDSLMYTVYKAMGSKDLALASFESFHRKKEQILNQEQLALLREQKNQFELREKNLTIANQQLQLDNASKEKLLLIIVNIILILAVAGGFLYQWLSQKAKKRIYRKERMMESILEEEKKKSQLKSTQIERIEIPEETQQPGDTQEWEHIAEDRKDLYQEMLSLIESQKLYLNPHLDQKLVITMLGTNRAYLYQAISQHAQANFKNIINHYRVKELKSLIHKLVQQGKTDFPDQLYLEAGFNSVASYHRIFKQFTGLTPKEYAAEYLKDLRNSGSN